MTNIENAPAVTVFMTPNVSSVDICTFQSKFVNFDTRGSVKYVNVFDLLAKKKQRRAMSLRPANKSTGTQWICFEMKGDKAYKQAEAFGNSINRVHAKARQEKANKQAEEEEKIKANEKRKYEQGHETPNTTARIGTVTFTFDLTKPHNPMVLSVNTFGNTQARNDVISNINENFWYYAGLHFKFIKPVISSFRAHGNDYILNNTADYIHRYPKQRKDMTDLLMYNYNEISNAGYKYEFSSDSSPESCIYIYDIYQY